MRTVTVCIASRGKPELLKQKVEEIFDTRRLPTTRVSVVVDLCDPLAFQFRRDGVVSRIGLRADDLGSAFNACAKQCPADLYVCGDDDRSYGPAGWDEFAIEAARQLPYGIGIVGEARKDERELPDFLGVTHKFAWLRGGLMPTHFPYWFIDTWIEEVARMSGTLVRAPITVNMRPEGTRGLRDLVWWSGFFERTRPMRQAEALKILATLGVHGAVARAKINAPVDMLKARQSSLFMPTTVRSLEGNAYDAEPTERYQRTKSRAVELLRHEGF